MFPFCESRLVLEAQLLSYWNCELPWKNSRLFRKKLPRDTLENEKANGEKPVKKHPGIKHNRLPETELPPDWNLIRSLRRRNTYQVLVFRLLQDKINSWLF